MNSTINYLLRSSKRYGLALQSDKRNSVILRSAFVLFITCALFLVNTKTVFAQVQESGLELGQSCRTAIPLSFDDANFSIPEALGVIEIEKGKSALSALYKEFNLTWYKFTTPEDGLVGFEIRPQVKHANIDFLVFKSRGKKTCSLIENGAIKPVRKNLAQAVSEQSSRTGLSVEQHSLSYGAPIASKKGEEFYIVVNNVHTTSGHQIRLKWYNTYQISGKVSINVPQSKTPAEVIWFNSEVDATVAEAKTDSAGNFVMTAIVDETDFQFNNYKLIITGKGYGIVDTTLTKKNIQAPLQVDLPKLVKGEVINGDAEHLYFKPNSAQNINDESKKRLNKLIKQMRFCPTLKIQLEGHSNGVYPSTEVDSKLSYTRAQSIKDYLVSKGIERHRIFLKAFGSANQLYPKAKNTKEESRNRRVEIRYLDF